VARAKFNSYTLQGWLKGTNVGNGYSATVVDSSGSYCPPGSALPSQVVDSRPESNALPLYSATGPFRLLEGSEYDAARKLANETILSLRRSNPDMFKGLQIHEIHPVKFGGSPTELSTPSAHAQYTNFWNALMRGIKKP
jgi:hypothetical protein